MLRLFLRTIIKTLFGVAVICVILPIELGAKPLDTRAGDNITVLVELIKQPMTKRHLTAKETSSFVQMAEKDSIDMQIVAALTLAWAKDNTSLKALQKLNNNSRSIIVRGASSYARTVRKCRGKTSIESRQLLTSRLAESSNSFERMFIANRLFVDSRAQSLSPILKAARNEKEKIVQCDMLYYLTDLSDKKTAKDVLAWGQLDNLFLPENLSFIMGSITPGRTMNDTMNSGLFLKDKLKRKTSKAK